MFVNLKTDTGPFSVQPEYKNTAIHLITIVGVNILFALWFA